MNTFDAITYIRQESLTRSDALKFLMQKLGFNAAYASEVLTAVFGPDGGINSAGGLAQKRAG